MSVFRHLIATLLLSFFISCFASAKDIHVSWNIGYVNVNRVGQNSFDAIGVNGKLPIPPVYAVKGDTLYLTVLNSLNVTTTVHAHGLPQNGTNYMDGPVMATQCGIPPGQKFIYKYHLTQPGTYWLHSHDKHQNADGLRTPLIIYDRDGPYKYDSEYLFFFEDWYTESFISRLERTLDTTKPPPPRASGYALINGFSGNYTKPIYFEPGKIYRLRLVNMSVNEWFQFSLPGHSLCVIETDGEYTQRKCVEGIELAPAQRYSVLVTAHDTSDFNYQYKVAMYTSLQSPVPGSVPPVFLGSVVYSASSPLWPASPSIENMVFASDIDLRSHSLEPPLPVTRSLNLTLGFGLFSNNQSLFVINDTPYGLPKVPTLFTALTMGKLAFDPRVYGKQANAVVLSYLDAVEITINNPTNRAHPMHIHNRSFQVYEFGPIGTNALNASAVQTNAIAPLKRDTVVVPGDKYVKIRYRADNPGVSLLHCHIDVHGALGMVMTIVEAPDLIQQDLRIPGEIYRQCKMQNIKTRGNAAGNWGVDMTGLPPPPTLSVI